MNITKVSGTGWLCIWSTEQNKWVPVIKLTEEQIVVWNDAIDGFFE